ncbi:nucleoside diphosphate kinase 6-like isoform X3 [Paramacrobiotus metropolitanus]|uniref:nucleoside diphosphate kinase 6-like isoform X3 n=1 Tax=Paramacrobiotus metropolitanus TaxID=2943436 RepID=UPI002445D156|nr:nucleoside diphosphate kinase 6-like isoform X3 [Paramacrobiotus metropolitanus]
MLRWRNIQRFFQRQKLSLVRTVASASDAISPMQLTLAIVKPHAVSQPFVVQGIDEAILKEGFYVVRNKEIYLSKDEASQFYAEHKGRFFYQRAVEMMASGPIIVKILARINAISHWRTLMGPTKVSSVHLPSSALKESTIVSFSPLHYDSPLLYQDKAHTPRFTSWKIRINRHKERRSWFRL